MNQQQRRRAITFTVIGITAVVVIAVFSTLRYQDTALQNFSDSYQTIVTQAGLLTQNYQKEVGKWQLKQYDNATMIKITNDYLPKFQNLINATKSLQSPKFEKAIDSYAKSLNSEMLSYMYFRNYLSSENRSAYKQSTQLLSDSLNNETESFNAFRNVT
jgi:nitrogen fixation/metabolism regulation signal transduction histidine kinase